MHDRARPRRSGRRAGPRSRTPRRRPSVYAVSIESVSLRAKVPFDLDPIDDHLQRRAVPQQCGVDVLERDGLAVHIQPAEPLAPQRRQRLRDGIDEIRQLRLRRLPRRPPPLLRRRRLLVVRALARASSAEP